MLYCLFLLPLKASHRLPGNAAASPSVTAAGKRSNFSRSRAAQGMPENALTRLPKAKFLVR